MRLSCNGCRVLRKGCAEACTIRPCLQWIKDPAAQSNATVFLAKFYGRAGLINLIDAGRDDAVRPAIFRSLLYEACGRVVNPVYGSVGLLWSGNWALCQAAVEAVLRGEPIVQISDEAAAAAASPGHLIHKAGFDIRHVAKHASNDAAGDSQKKQAPGADDDSQKKKAGRAGLKRTSASSTSGTRSKKPKQNQPPSPPEGDDRRRQHQERAPSHASSISHHDDHQQEESVDDTDAEASGSHVSQAEQQHSRAEHPLDDEEEPQQQLGLDLSLGLAPLAAAAGPCVPPPVAGAGCGGLTSCWKEPGGLAFRFL